MSSVEVLHASILIVDDESANLQLLEELLRQAGYSQIVTTTNPRDVFELHRLNNFDLILLDMEFPDMDGYEVMQALKASVTDPYLSVIVLTAHPGHKLRALQAGAKDFISKPFDVVEVTTRIHNILEVRLLYKALESYVAVLEQRVIERTAELAASEARYRGFTELASDWYWEQDSNGEYTKLSGPVPHILGIQVKAYGPPIESKINSGWNPEQQEKLQAMIAAHISFIDYEFSRTNPDGSQQTFRVSGQPMFDSSCKFLGYRGIGVEVATKILEISDATPTVP